MVDKKEFEEVVLREKERSLHISRLPTKIKEEFTNFANEEFAEDYGMALREIWEKYKEFLLIHNNFDIKLNYIIGLIEKSTASQEEEPGTHTMLSGRRVKGGKNNNGKFE